MNRHKIFSSLFSLNFKNSEIDKLFRKYKNEEKKLKILIVFLVCTQIINTILSYILKPMNFSISFENPNSSTMINAGSLVKCHSLYSLAPYKSC